MLYYFDPKFWREDWRGATTFLKSNLDQDTRVVFAWPQPFDPYKWYGGQQGMGVVELPYNQEKLENRLGYLVAYRKIYLFEYLQALADPSNRIQKWLKDHEYSLIQTHDFQGVGFIFEYQKD